MIARKILTESSVLTDIKRLRIARFRMNLTALDPIELPRYSGSTWRGLFGQSLKRAVCVTREPECQSCLLYRSCVYSYIFETPRPNHADRMRLYQSVPHPFIISPDGKTSIQCGEKFSVTVTLLGRAVDNLPYTVHAFREGGKLGLGRNKGHYELESVLQESFIGSNQWQPILVNHTSLKTLPTKMTVIPPASDQVTLRLITPLRLRVNNRYINESTLAFQYFFDSLLRRISMLSYFHEGIDLKLDYVSLSSRAKQIAFHKKNIEWKDLTRYSSRQNTTMKMSGLVGSLEINNADLPLFWPLLWMGQWTHVGKFTVMGLGQYAIESTSTSLAD